MMKTKLVKYDNNVSIFHLTIIIKLKKLILMYLFKNVLFPICLSHRINLHIFMKMMPNVIGSFFNPDLKN